MGGKKDVGSRSHDGSASLDKGVRINRALRDFASDEAAGRLFGALARKRSAIFKDGAESYVTMDANECARYQSLLVDLRRELLANIHSGILSVTGVWDNDRARTPVTPGMFLDAEIDVDRNEITMPGHLVRSVRIARASGSHSMPATATEESPPRKKVSGRLDYREADKPLLEEMHQGIEAGRFSGITDAARAVGERALGKGLVSSKVTRLITGYSKVFRPDHN